MWIDSDLKLTIKHASTLIEFCRKPYKFFIGYGLSMVQNLNFDEVFREAPETELHLVATENSGFLILPLGESPPP